MRATLSLIAPLSLCASSLVAQTGADQWILESGTVTYHVSHPLHQTDGVSHLVRGKGLCQGGQCQFLIATPLKSFDSGDSNRDLHMLQVTKGAEFPMVTVRTQLPEAAAGRDTIDADLDIEFAGQTVHYTQVPFHIVAHGNEEEVSGVIPLTLSAFHIDPPSLFSIPVKNDVPVRIDLTWRKAS